MADEIAVILKDDGTTGTLGEPGLLAVYSREAGTWKNVRGMSLAPDPSLGLKGMRAMTAGIISCLGDCCIIVTRSAGGALYFELEKARCALWEIAGRPGEFLDQVWADEEKERASAAAPAPAGSIPRPQEKTPGNFFISIKEVQGKRPDMSSKQILMQFIQSGGFLVLDILCSHVPPWIEAEAERRGYTLETEQVDRDSVKVRLTTNAGR